MIFSFILILWLYTQPTQVCNFKFGISWKLSVIKVDSSFL